MMAEDAANKNEVEKPVGIPASLAGFQDEGRLKLLVNEEELGGQEFTWTSDGALRCLTTLKYAGQTVETSIEIEPDSEGVWKRITKNSPLGDFEITREGSQVSRHFKSQSKDTTSTLETPAGAIIFDNDAVVLISQAVRLYDRSAGGAQKFSLLVGIKDSVDLTIEAKETAVRTVAGNDLHLTRFLFGIPGLDIYVRTDVEGRIYAIDIPAQRVAFVRQGFEALQKAEIKDELLSKPEYEVQDDRDVRVPMRDGVELVTDVYRPVGVDKAPVILLRTPYKKEMLELQAMFYARRGYVFAVQDCRGRFGSGGHWRPFVNEGDDGYDAIEWLAGQPYSNGKVGMIGGSYSGWVQWWAAVRQPPHLKTIIPNVAPPDPFYNLPYEYGAFCMLSLWWVDVVESEATADVSGAAFTRMMDKKHMKLMQSLPVIDLDKLIVGKENKYWREWIAHPTDDEYWEAADFQEKLANVGIPVFHQSGWFDGDGIGSKLNYLGLAAHKHPLQKLTLGPWGHTDSAMRMIGERDFGENAIIDLSRDYLRWFDHFLKEIDNGIDKEPLVSMFVMGSNRWVYGQHYPLETSTFQKLYLTSGGNANTGKGDGRLSFDAPSADVPPDKYTYDPADPTPDRNAYTESDEDEKRVLSVAERKKNAENYQRTLAENRRDILVYDTEPLTTPLSFVGPLSAVLYASSSAVDTDWFMTLLEIDESGKPFRLAQGKVRARYRNSMKHTELLETDRVYEYQLDLWHTGIQIPAGARLRVEVASASFPLFSRNLNTGGHNEVETEYVSAEQTIYHDAERPSHILLPVIQED